MVRIKIVVADPLYSIKAVFEVTKLWKRNLTKPLSRNCKIIFEGKRFFYSNY